MGPPGVLIHPALQTGHQNKDPSHACAYLPARAQESLLSCLIFIFLLFSAKEESPQVNSKLEALDANVCVGHVLLQMKRQIEISEI